MGVEKSISIDCFPKQTFFVGQKFTICFNYDTSKTIDGVCVREDEEYPHICIFQLTDGRFVLSTECQYRHADRLN